MAETITEKLPEFLLSSLEKYYGEDSKRIINGFSCERRSSFRVNTIKNSNEEVLDYLANTSVTTEKLPWFENGFVCGFGDDRVLRGTKLFEEGKIYLQSPSSMIPPVLLGSCAAMDVLDMCAAPGGKTTQIAAMSGGKCGIMACENDKVRAERLRYNLEKQGVRANVQVCDASKLDNFFRFDRILLDAPCSGSGTILLSNPSGYRAFSEKLVRNSCKIQQKLLKKALTLLKKGGEMVYSTCSILPIENEEVVRAALPGTGAEIVPFDSGEFADVPVLNSSLEGAMLVCPNEIYEGFFAVKLWKK